jgi:hypothetical protein
MGKPHIIERLRKRLKTGKYPKACRQAIRLYERERDEAADEIDRLLDQLSVVHACAADNEYFQWEKIEQLETALGEMLRVFGGPIPNGSVDAGTFKGARQAVRRARAALARRSERLAKIFTFH